MDAVKYLEERKRMCASYNNMCIGCGFGQSPKCINTEDYNPKEALAIVEKWSAEHPIKTRQSEFLKMFPNTRLNECGSIAICPRICDASFDPQECDYKNCLKCEKDYWSAEVE